MPLTFPAHQAPLLPCKIWRPQWFDGVALCAGAGAPDLAYPLGDWMQRQSHTLIGVVVWGIPVTLVITFVLRWRAAAGIFAHLPDTDTFRLRSFRVITRVRHPIAVTMSSAVLGVGSHVFIDGFTHEGRWGADLLGLNAVLGEVPWRGEVTGARVLQYAGHGFGTMAALALLAYIGRHRLLERWHGESLVADVRGCTITTRERLVFWTVAAVPPALAATLSIVTGRDPLFATLSATVLGFLFAGVTGARQPIDQASGSG